MAGFSFTSAGSTPFKFPTPTGTGAGSNSFLNGYSTPVSKALNAATGRSIVTGNAPYSRVADTPAPSTPVKKTTVNNVDGSSQVTEYHAPTAGLLSSKTDASGTTKPAAPAPAPTQYAGYVSKLAEASKPSEKQGKLIMKVQDTAAGNEAIAENARRIAEEYGKEIADVGRLGAGAVAGDLSTGTNAVGAGNAAIAAQSASQRMQALSDAEQAALQGTGQQLTAQGQEASALNAAGGLQNTQQANQITGLGNAAGYLQPSPAAYGQTVFNPGTGTFESGGGLPPDVLQQYAQMAANGQYDSIPADIRNNIALSAQVNAAAKAINPSYSPIVSSAEGSSATALTNSLNELQSQANRAEANFALLVDTATKGGVNSGNVPALNTLEQNVKKGLASDAAVTLFKSTLASVRSQYATILGGGTITDAARASADEQIPDNISLAALQSLQQQLKNEAQNGITALQQQINQSQGLSSSGGSDTTTVGKYSYRLVNGKWVLAQ